MDICTNLEQIMDPNILNFEKKPNIKILNGTGARTKSNCFRW